MNAPTNIQIINGPDGTPAFVVIPYADYIADRVEARDLIPHAVIERTVEGASPARAWREHLGLTQVEVAKRLGVSQPTYAQLEGSETLRKSSRLRIAAALGILPAQLDF